MKFIKKETDFMNCKENKREENGSSEEEKMTEKMRRVERKQ